MFLADAVAAYVEALNERELDAPLIALLYRLGFVKVHLVHGQYEFGKDFIARRIEEGIEYQYCIQSKSGDLGASQWRDVRQQVDAMRTGSVVHPDFDPKLPRRLIVATNGRLKGGAGVEFQNYNEYHDARGEAGAELWDLDYLVPHFVEVLVEGVKVQDRARTLEMLGSLGQGRGSRASLREYARTWIDRPVDTTSERWSQILTGAMLARAAAAAGRDDLAKQIAFHLLRAAWQNPVNGQSQSSAQLDVARRLFVTHATEIWDRVRDTDSLEVTTRTRTGLDAFVTHPVKCARLCECLALLALKHHLDGDAGTASAIVDYLEGVVNASPGVAHPVSDEWSYSLLITVTLLCVFGRSETARSALREAAVWVLDWVEYGNGIAAAGEDATQALRQLLGSPYNTLRRPPQREAYAFAVIADLAYLCGFNDLFADIVNDIHAVGAIATLVLDTGQGKAELVGRVEYSTEGVPARHHEVAPTVTAPGAAGAWFDCFAIWSTMRDRHLPSVITAVLELP